MGVVARWWSRGDTTPAIVVRQESWRLEATGAMSIESESLPPARDGAAMAHLYNGQGLDVLVLAGGNGGSCPLQEGDGSFGYNCQEVWLLELKP
ncbi:MAG: hypothetical protein JRH20_24200 [Deltaproteobacteria bacterium]|nr:hypothetical protein [Deltaproteobacteria bacterium]